ncbi:hypothetical protein [Methylobacterium nodulans]|uniref:Uncharacterized protein n=1 Tax=Methylobacterium nodulans (strain LMG 21967 / CNCM I-2342 / ORS 2060) TaxID=460265 RepID=B8IGC6_METNO|nr:hypothetical protein [Methylobacterium nodulans]ACL55826.1 hypothetical protein Mnod_0796 [Methylobacterium nodulans ORS 2060]
MLNELLLIKRGLTQNGFDLSEIHADIKDVGKDTPLRVRLATNGAIARIAMTERGQAVLWTLRDGQHNSFPFTKLGRPLLALPDEERPTEAAWRKMTAGAKRTELLRLIAAHPLNATWMPTWPGTGLRKRLRERLDQLTVLAATDSAAVPATFERFLKALDRTTPILIDLADHLVREIEESEAWITIARSLLLEGGSLYFDVDDDDFDRDAGDSRNKGPISSALSGDGTGGMTGRCSLTGAITRLHEGNFPQPNLPSLGQTYLFAKNKEIPAAHRYGRFAAGAFPVGSQLLKRLGGSLSEITESSRKGITWQLIPSEKPKQSDLLLAFLPGDLTLPIAGVVASETPDLAEQAVEALNRRRIAYETNSQRALADLDGRVRHRSAVDGVQLCIIRKLDPANRKAIFSRLVTVEALHAHALRWRDGCINHPPLAMLVPGPKGEKARRAPPPPIAPADIPAMTRKQFVDGGRRTSDLSGVGAAEVFALFLEEGDVRQRARMVLRTVLQRHGSLLAAAPHALRRSLEDAKDYDRAAALRSVTLLSILLHKADRPKESYMTDAAFKLGQLLAAADVVHVGYCADLRGGNVPPVLLGNAVLSMAQSKPNRALAVLCGRWKPYGAWAKGGTAWRRAAELNGKGETSRAIAIRTAIGQARQVSDLSSDLSAALPDKPAPDRADVFRAELLLGYLAGLPRKEEQGAGAQSGGKDGGNASD